MSHDDERDYAEEAYNRDLCPGCNVSPCPDGGRCEDELPPEGWRPTGTEEDEAARREPDAVVDEVIAPLPDHEDCVDGLGLAVGQRVELHPATDAWMRGDRFGVIVSLGRKYVHVLMDRSGRTRKLAPFLVDVVR